MKLSENIAKSSSTSTLINVETNLVKFKTSCVIILKNKRHTWKKYISIEFKFIEWLFYQRLSQNEENSNIYAIKLRLGKRAYRTNISFFSLTWFEEWREGATDTSGSWERGDPPIFQSHHYFTKQNTLKRKINCTFGRLKIILS